MVSVSQMCFRLKGFGGGAVYRRFGGLSQGVHWGSLSGGALGACWSALPCPATLQRGASAIKNCLEGVVGVGGGVVLLI